MQKDPNSPSAKNAFDTQILFYIGSGKVNQGLALLIKMYGPGIKSVITKRYGHPQLDVEDVLLESVTLFWRHYASYDPSKGGIMPWILTIASRVACDHRRYCANQPQLLADAENFLANPVEDPDWATSKPPAPWIRVLHDAIDSDPSPIQRQILSLELQTGQRAPVKELAEKLNKSPGTIRAYRSRAVKRLLTVLPQLHPYFLGLGGNHEQSN